MIISAAPIKKMSEIRLTYLHNNNMCTASVVNTVQIK